MPRTRVSSRIANDFVRAIVIVTVAMCSSGGHALVARSIAQPSSSPSPIAAGATHSMAVTPAGQVWTWGDNRVGQLGTGDTASHASPVPVAGLSNEFIAVSAGLGHSLALDYLGRVWSWGLNSDGQLGDGSRTRRLSPILVVQANDVVAIAAGSVHSLALRSDGRVLAWGGNLGAQLGDGTQTGRTRPVVIAGLTDVIAIAAGTAHSLALRSDGSVWAWGTNLTGQLGVTGALLQRLPVRIPSLANIALISAGGGHSVAVTASGQGWAWGWNAFGQLGDGTRTMRRTPIAIQGVAEVSRISAGATHTLAATAAGELFAWGGNDAGQLGDGTTTNRLTPTLIQPPPSQVIEVAAGAVHSLLLVADRSAWSWGNNVFGQLGDGSHVTSPRPTPISGLNQTVAPPTFSPEGGLYDAPIEVTISTTTPNAVIHYTTNGDDPTESDPVADAPLVIDHTTILSARAFKAGMTESDVSIAEYVFAVLPPPDAPTFSHEGGFFSSPIDVSIATTTPDAEIRYTLDGSEPHAASELYTGPLHIATGTTIKARAFQGGRGSSTSGVTILFDFGRAATPTATPAAGMYVPPLNVTLSAQPGASIYFTLDGSAPSESSTLYVSPIAIAATATLQARAFHPDYTQSRVLTVAYVIDDSPTGPPVDPSTIAPPVDPTEQTEFAEATAFLYTGPNRIQRGVAPGAIVPARVTVLRGMVRNRNGAPIGGVRIAALNEPGLGHTLTRDDGMFDFAVNGGGRVAIDYVADGYLPVQRTIPTGWNDYMWAPDVMLTALDPNVTVLPMASSEALAARGSAITDADGTRQATLIVPEGGIVANIELADGTRLSAVSQLSIRATEYTVGPGGRAAMPGDLPNTSGYTYAVELSADEAIAAHATRVTFDRPLPFYVENFLGFPVGGAVPTGYFDRQRGEWVASDNGRIVGIVSETDGAADLDLNGDAIADDAAALTALGVTDGERRRLAVLYEPGQSLWRVPIPHFTPWDHNWPYRVPEDADHPNAPPPEQRDRVNDGCEVQHSIVECESQALGERVGVTGTPFTLNYRSNRQPGSAGPSTITIPLTGLRVPASLRRIDLEVRIAGRRFLQTFPPTAGVKATITWDGKDAYGRTVYGGHAATATIKHVYGAIYTQPALLPRSFAQAGNGPIFVDRSANEFVFEQTSVITMRSAMSPAATIGGWSLDAHHVFDRIGNTIWLGDGGRRDAGRSGYDLKEWDPYVRGQRLNGVLPDGAAMMSDSVDGSTLATREGSRGGLWMGDTPPECQSTPFHVYGFSLGLASGSGGQIYYAVTNSASGGTVTRLCFGRANRTGPENTGIFTSIQLPQPQTQVRAYLAADTSGVMYAAAGRYLYQLNPGGNPVLVYTAPGTIIGLSLTPGGDVIMATKTEQFSLGAGQLRRRSVSGQVTVIGGAATGSCTAPRLDGPFDPAAVICVNAVTAARDGSIIYVDLLDTGSFSGADSLVRRLWPDGFVTTLARTSTFISDLAIVRDDEIYAADGRLKSIVPALAENLTGAAAITSADGALVYEFAPSGRHLRTRDAVTGVAYFTFGYNTQGFLISVTDREGQVTRIERDGAGTPQAIVGPYGHRTALQVNTDGYLTSITDPLGGVTTLDYRAGGLLTMFGTPNGHASEFDYDDGGRLTSDRDGAGGELTLTRTNLPNGWSVQTEDSLGRQEGYTVAETAPGRHLRTKEFADGTTWTRQDLADGSEDVAADGTRRRVVMAPDPRFGQQAAFPTSVTTTLPSGLASTVTVARSVQNVLFSNPPELISIDEITTIGGLEYSKRHHVPTRTITTTSPANRQTVTTFDALGRPLSARVGTSLLPTTFTYDARGRLATQRQGARTTTFAYDAGGSLASVTDPLLRTVQFTSDLARRRTSQTFPDLREATFAYDANGNLTSLTPPGRPAHTMAYTPANLLENYTAPILASPTVTQYQFDLAKQPTTVTRADGQQITWAYDTPGRPETLTTPTGTTSYAYHPTTGQLSSLTSPSSGLTYRYDGALQTGETFSGFVSGVVTWDYDSFFRVTAERVNGSSPITFTYDADNLLTGAGAVTYTRRADDGFLLATALGSAVTTYTYSGFGELATEESRHAAAVLYSAVYTRDNGGRLTERAETIGGAATTDAYSYDLAGRLTAVTRGGALLASYTYDANGNRTSVTTSAGTRTATYDDQDRIVTFGDRTYTHIAHGEVRRWTDGSGTTTLSYDVQGNLIAVSLPTGATVEYVVDARNRRIGRKVNGAVTHGWLYQGQLRPIAELDSTGAVVSRFVYGARAVAPEFMIRGGTTYRLVTDHLGSVRLVVDTASGIVAQRLDYDAMGQVLSDTNPGFQPFGYAGGFFDSLTGLVRFGARDYDASIGRWLSKDPIGFRGGDSNLYAYAGNDPMNAIDPTGLFVWEVIDVITFIQDVRDFLGCPGVWTGVAVVVGAIGVLPGVTAIGWVDNVAKNADPTLVIGRGRDLDKGLGSSEFRLQWDPKSTVKEEWKENAGRLRAEMNKGNPIRDASAPDDTGGMYLNAERALLRDRGWTYNPGSGHWLPPR